MTVQSCQETFSIRQSRLIRNPTKTLYLYLYHYHYQVTIQVHLRLLIVRLQLLHNELLSGLRMMIAAPSRLCLTDHLAFPVCLVSIRFNLMIPLIHYHSLSRYQTMITVEVTILCSLFLVRHNLSFCSKRRGDDADSPQSFRISFSGHRAERS